MGFKRVASHHTYLVLVTPSKGHGRPGRPVHLLFLWRPLRSFLAFCDSSHLTKTIVLRELRNTDSVRSVLATHPCQSLWQL